MHFNVLLTMQCLYWKEVYIGSVILGLEMSCKAAINGAGMFTFMFTFSLILHIVYILRILWKLPDALILGAVCQYRSVCSLVMTN